MICKIFPQCVMPFHSHSLISFKPPPLHFYLSLWKISYIYKSSTINSQYSPSINNYYHPFSFSSSLKNPVQCCFFWLQRPACSILVPQLNSGSNVCPPQWDGGLTTGPPEVPAVQFPKYATFWTCFLWCLLSCSFASCISCKLAIRSKKLDKFRLYFWLITLHVEGGICELSQQCYILLNWLRGKCQISPLLKYMWLSHNGGNFLQYGHKASSYSLPHKNFGR